MNKLSFKRLDIEYIFNMNTKLNENKGKNKINSYIIAICLLIVIIYIIMDGFNLLYLLILTFGLLVALIIKQRNLIVFRNILESILKRDIKSIEFSKNNIKVCDGNILVLNSYSSINLLVEYKNIIIIKYIPIKNSNHEEQVILIPKNIFVNKDELIKFKELITSKINKEQFKFYDENLKIEDKINNLEKAKCEIYLISSVALFTYLIFCFI